MAWTPPLDLLGPDGSSDTDSSSDLDVTVEDRPDSLTVRVRGELDLATCGLLDAVLRDCLRERRGRRVQVLDVDTSAVSFADAAGISPLVHTRTLLARRGGQLRLNPPGTAVRHVLHLLERDEMLPPVDASA